MEDCFLGLAFDHRGDGFEFKLVESHLSIRPEGLVLRPFDHDACSRLVNQNRTDVSPTIGKLELCNASKEVQWSVHSSSAFDHSFDRCGVVSKHRLVSELVET